MPEDPLHLVCVEPVFPGRLGAVADWLVRRRGYWCQFFCASAEPRGRWPEATGRGLDVIQFGVGGVAREPSVAWTGHLERGLCYAYGFWEVLDARRPHPVDLVLGRSAGLGSSLFVPVSQPRLPIVNYFDTYLHTHEHDLAGLLADLPPEYARWRRAAGAVELLDLENVSLAWTATAWQRDQFPEEYRDDFLVLFDGVDPRRFDRRARRPRRVAGRDIPDGMRVVSFMARELDRTRGFDRFAALADRLMREREDVLCIAAGGPIVRRGLDVPFFNRDYPAEWFRERPLADPDRFWMPGDLPPAEVAALLAISDLHVEAGRAFPASRALVEAMAAGCVVLGWDEAPTREFLTPGRTGLLAPPDDPDAAARLALEVLDAPAAHRPLGEGAAAEARERYAQDVTLPALARVFDRLAAGG